MGGLAENGGIAFPSIAWHCVCRIVVHMPCLPSDLFAVLDSSWLV